MCTVSAQSINFGSYDVFSNSNLESTGNISISCDSAVSYTIALSSGSGTFSDRTLTFSSYLLSYNLFIDAARTMIWGDGSGGTSAVSGMASTTANHIVYGRVPARQNAYVGNYNDNVNVTVSF
jgi:spore coat protein U-like protein